MTTPDDAKLVEELKSNRGEWNSRAAATIERLRAENERLYKEGLYEQREHESWKLLANSTRERAEAAEAASEDYVRQIEIVSDECRAAEQRCRELEADAAVRLADLNLFDKVVRALNIEDSTTSPIEAIEALYHARDEAVAGLAECVALLASRDIWIVDRGLWHDFTDVVADCHARALKSDLSEYGFPSTATSAARVIEAAVARVVHHKSQSEHIKKMNAADTWGDNSLDILDELETQLEQADVELAAAVSAHMKATSLDAKEGADAVHPRT